MANYWLTKRFVSVRQSGDNDPFKKPQKVRKYFHVLFLKKFVGFLFVSAALFCSSNSVGIIRSHSDLPGLIRARFRLAGGTALIVLVHSAYSNL